jgi:UDP-N-acetylmuramate dehydrogenase
MVTVEVAAGESWDDLVALAVAEGWSGLECLSGIPGLVGASPIQNVGAYGQEVAAVIDTVRTWDRTTGTRQALAAADCGFGYRTSRFKTEPNRFVVLAVTMSLRRDVASAPIRYDELATALGVRPGARVPLAEARQAVLEVRSRKGMVLDPADHDTWSAGSFFTNPVLDAAAFDALRARVRARLGPDAVPPGYPAPDGSVKTSAAWLIERAGFARGYGNAQVRVSSKHTLALTNRGTATTADLLALAGEIQAGVAAMFGVDLTVEPVVVGTR